MKSKLLIFASGTKDGGGSGFENLVAQSRENPELEYEVAAVVSNWSEGGVRERADRLGVPFIHLGKDNRTPEEYERVVKESGADYVALSGWLKLVPMKATPDDSEPGLDPARTFNIHPGPLPQFGGAGMYGIHVHEAIVDAFKKGEAEKSAVTMHFVTKQYDEGPVFFRYPVPVEEGDTAETLQSRVNKAEHEWQPKITSLVCSGEISWDGKTAGSLVVPDGYTYL